LAIFLGMAVVLGPTQGRADDRIFDIQLQLYNIGDPVTVDSVVVTGVGFWGFSIQEPEPDPTWEWQWSGIWVYTGNSHLGQIRRGDLVRVSGIYEEYYDFSEIDITQGGSFTVIDHDWPIPDPVPLLISEINDTGIYAENYEGVLVRVDRNDNTLYARAPDQYDEWYLGTEPTPGVGDSILMDHVSAAPGGDFGYETPQPGTELSYAQGILVYNYGQYKIAPRNCEEDLGMPCKPALAGAYSTGTTGVDVEFTVNVDSLTASDPQNYELLSGLLVLSAERDPDNHKLVHLVTEPQPDGQPEQIIVSGVFSEVGGLEMDPNQTADFRSGITPISMIQYVADPGLDDASPLLDEVVTVRGRVSAMDGSYYYLQDGSGGPWNEIYCRVARVGDLQVGDSVQVAAEVREYYGYTELGHRPGVNHFVNLGPASAPVTITDVTAADIIYDSVAVAEPYEGVLVRITQAMVDSSLAGTTQYGEWFLIQEPDTAACDLDGLAGANVSYQPCVGDTVNMTGVLGYSYGEYRIYPRGDSDIELISSGCPASVPEVGSGAALWLAIPSPNPFRPSTRIRFRLGSAERVTLAIYGTDGRLVRAFYEGEKLDPGLYAVAWEGRNTRGEPVPSGVYFVRLRAGSQERSAKLLLVR
jgi:hypothetical protein